MRDPERSTRPPLEPGRRKAKSGEVAELREMGLPCPECGEDHIRKSGEYGCVGHNSYRKPCGNRPIDGGTVCAQRHGGSSSVISGPAKRRVAFAAAQGEAAKLMREMDFGDQHHPIDGLLEVVRHAGSMMRAFQFLVSGLDTDPAEAWHTEHGPGGALKEVRYSTNEAIIGFNSSGEQVADVRVVLYERWATLYMRACKTALDADIDERLVRNATTTSTGFFKAIGAGLDAAELTPEQRLAFQTAVAKALRKMGPGMTIDG